MSHTPGPWGIVQDAPLNPKSRYSIGSRQPNGFAIYVCTIRTERSLILDGKETANARLIAAAPELIEACRAVVERWESGNLAEATRMCAAAIAKAEGREA